MVSEWGLPKPLTHIWVDRDELLVLDWHLSGHYLCNVGRGFDIGEVIGAWHEFRGEVWTGILELSELHNPGIPPVLSVGHIPVYNLPMDERIATYLFNWLPTTFMWGTGRDCGFTLKVKLHKFLHGEEEVSDDNANAAPSGPKDTSIYDA